VLIAGYAVPLENRKNNRMKTFEISLSQLAEIIFNAETKWGADYGMIEYEVGRQLTAFANTQTYFPQGA